MSVDNFIQVHVWPKGVWFSDRESVTLTEHPMSYPEHVRDFMGVFTSLEAAMKVVDRYAEGGWLEYGAEIHYEKLE